MRGLVLPLSRDEVNAFADFLNESNNDDLFSKNEHCKHIRDRLQFLILMSVRHDQELPDCYECYQKLGEQSNENWENKNKGSNGS
jgi:hypothetical protein